MTGRILHGTPASPDVAVGPAWRLALTVQGPGMAASAEDRAEEVEAAIRALAAAARELTEVAAGLASEQAEIVEAGALMAEDPALAQAVEEAVTQDALAAPEAILSACGQLADAIAAVGDETLAARADDVRSLGRRAARLARGDARSEALPQGAIVIAEDLGPGDVAELAAAAAGFALARGGSTAHAAIVARSLGIPMVTGLGPDVLAVAPGTELVLDGAAGTVDVAPAAARAAAVRARRRATVEDDGRPAVTRDGRRIGVLANVATAAEVSVALRGGAEGVGLLRTELAFLEAPDWPSEQQHVEMLEPLLAALHSDPPRPAIVRVLDFGADKAPPFLRDVRARGLELLLENAGAFLAQLRAILVCARRHQGVRVMLPLVQSAEEVAAARSLLRAAARSLGTEVVPPLGAMIETQAAVRAAPEIARCSDFLSIGTNDLTASVLGSDRFAAAGGAAHDPRVLRCVAHTVAAGHAAGRSIEVCGEAASEPVMVPLLVGLRVDQLSVGAARVPMVRSWVRELSAAEAGRRARSALSLGTAEHVASLCSREGGDGGGERLERSSGVHAVGA